MLAPSVSVSVRCECYSRRAKYVWCTGDSLSRNSTARGGDLSGSHLRNFKVLVVSNGPNSQYLLSRLIFLHRYRPCFSTRRRTDCSTNGCRSNVYQGCLCHPFYSLHRTILTNVFLVCLEHTRKGCTRGDSSRWVPYSIDNYINTNYPYFHCLTHERYTVGW